MEMWSDSADTGAPETGQAPEVSHVKNAGGSGEKLLSDQVSVDCMDIIKGRLDDISRPASSTSEVRRVSREGQRSLEVLSPDLSHTQQVAHDRTDLSPEDSSDPEESEEGNEDSELRRAVQKMKRLDRILTLKTSAEREVKKRSREIHHTLWEELQAVSLQMSCGEMENTRRFLALTPVHGSSSAQDCDEPEFVPVFETEVQDLPDEVNTTHETEEGSGQQVTEDRPADSRHRGAAHSERRQDFIKKNIELAGVSGNTVHLTQQEKERIEELLRDLEEEQNDSDPLDEPQVCWSLCRGEGFSPDASDQISLRHIDSRLQLLLPAGHFLSQAETGDGGHRRDEDRRLREIQTQLQDLEESSAVSLSADQLERLLRDCEETPEPHN